MKTLIFTLMLSLVTFAGCTTKNNSMSDAPGTGISAQNGGVQTTESAAPATGGTTSETPVASATPAQ